MRYSLIIAALSVCAATPALAGGVTRTVDMDVDGHKVLVEVEQDACSTGSRIEVEVVVGGVTRVITVDCDAVFGSRPTKSDRLSRIFRMGLRAQFGAMYVPRTAEIGEGVPFLATGSLVFQAPTVFGSRVGLEFSAGSGVSYFPILKDTLSTNVFEFGLLIKTTDFFDVTLGYQFSTLGDIDENLTHSHRGFVRVAWEVTRHLELGATFYAGGAIAAQKHQRSKGNDMGTVTYVETDHVRAFSPALTIDVFVPFW